MRTTDNGFQSMSQANGQQTGATHSSGDCGFRTTHWSVVLAAGHESSGDPQQALATLCETYWYPLYVFVRRQGHGAADAQDLTQAFFASLLERDDFAKVRPERGRFRAFLLASMRHFLANEWDRRRTEKRGGHLRRVSIDFAQGESRYLDALGDTTRPEDVFDREWALTLLDHAGQQLGAHYEQKGQRELFEKLKDFMTGRPPGSSYKTLPEELDMTDGAVRVAIHRMRRRFGELVRAAIAETTATDDEIDDEIRHLFAVLRT